MAGLDPATQRSHVSARKRLFSLANARWLGGRLKGGHDDRGLALQPVDAEQLLLAAPSLPRREPGLLRQRAEILHRVFVRILGVDRLALRERDLMSRDAHTLLREAHQMHLDAACI